jgi:carbon storage regulator
MLVLARKTRESVVIAARGNSDDLVRVTVIDVCGGRVKLGFEAAGDVAIHREEVWQRVRAEGQPLKAVDEPPQFPVLYSD